jgi:formylglycine-generating enzyme required for sulfatase activity
VNIATGTVPDAVFWRDYDDGFEIYAPVGMFAVNAFGLFNMHGNVAEFTRGHANASYKNAVHAPGDGELLPPRDPTMVSPQTVQRGGSWFRGAEDARSASRVRVDRSERLDATGIRPARKLNR